MCSLSTVKCSRSGVDLIFLETVLPGPPTDLPSASLVHWGPCSEPIPSPWCLPPPQGYWLLLPSLLEEACGRPVYKLMSRKRFHSLLTCNRSPVNPDTGPFPRQNFEELPPCGCAAAHSPLQLTPDRALSSAFCVFSFPLWELLGLGFCPPLQAMLGPQTQNLSSPGKCFGPFSWKCLLSLFHFLWERRHFRCQPCQTDPWLPYFLSAASFLSFLWGDLKFPLPVFQMTFTFLWLKTSVFKSSVLHVECSWCGFLVLPGCDTSVSIPEDHYVGWPFTCSPSLGVGVAGWWHSHPQHFAQLVALLFGVFPLRHMLRAPCQAGRRWGRRHRGIVMHPDRNYTSWAFSSKGGTWLRTRFRKQCWRQKDQLG